MHEGVSIPGLLMSNTTSRQDGEEMRVSVALRSSRGDIIEQPDG